MGGRINTQCQATDDGEAGIGQYTGKSQCVFDALRCGIAATDDTDSGAVEIARIAIDIEQAGRVS